MEATTGARLGAEVAALLRARNALIWVVTPEEVRAERAIVEAAGAAGYASRAWDCGNGVATADGQPYGPGREGIDPDATLRYIGQDNVRAVWIMRDLPPWLRQPTTSRILRNLARTLPSVGRDAARAIVVLSPSDEVPADLRDHAVVVKWELPDRAELARIYDSLPADVRELSGPDGRAASIEAAVGLSAEQAATCFAKSIVTQGRRVVPAIVAAEKKRVVGAGKGLEWFDPDPRGLDAVGGLDGLKPWLRARSKAFDPKARAFGIDAPKGVLLVGVPGCGKSLTAKAIASAWQVPLLRLDLGGARSKYVGESEGNIRAALATARAIGRCVLWLDEIEKALQGATGGAADGGVATDALGTLLSWMQENSDGVFVVATANDVSGLPPELLRKGRFDEVFFVDLPTAAERAEIAMVALRKRKRDASGFDTRAVADATAGYTGAEIDALVAEGIMQAFADGDGARDVATADLLAAAAATVPLSRTAPEKINRVREWAKGRARPASTPEAASTVAATAGRNFD